MEYKINQKTGLVQNIRKFVEPSERDVQEAFILQHWVENKPCPHCNGSLPDSYSVMKKLWETKRDLLILSGTEGIRSDAKRGMSEIKFAILSGYLDAINMPNQMINFANSKFEEEFEKIKNRLEGKEPENYENAI